MSHFTGPLLPKFAVPSAYDLRLDLDVVAGSFTGTVAVNVELLETSRFIVLNGLGLSVDKDASSFTPRESSEVVPNGGDLSANSAVSSSPKKPSQVEVILIKCYEEKIILEFESFLPKGEGVLKLKFSGVLNKETSGLFICCGENEKMSARMFFPCWDEPVYKATFKITVQVPVEFVAVSNMPISKEVASGNTKTFSFHVSPSMPTYLVTMVVGLLDFLEDHTSGMQVRVYGEAGKGEKVKSVLHAALQTLKLFKEYFGVSYPLPKLDLVAVQHLAAERPRESFGLVVYPVPYESESESDLLQRVLFSGYWSTTRQYSGTNQSGTRNDEKEILLGDIVVNRETKKVSRVGLEDNKLFLFPIDRAEKEELRKDKVVVVSRPFFFGQPVCLVTDQKQLGVICGIDMRVDLATSGGKIAYRDIGTEKLKRNRSFFVGDTVILGSWFGIVEAVELTLKLWPQNGEVFNALEAEPEDYEPIFKNAAESYLYEPYYVGQEVIDHVFDEVGCIVTKHNVDRLKVKWIHCNSLRREKKPAASIFYQEVERIHDPRATRVTWALGSRCVFKGREFLIAGVRSLLKVKWQSGSVEEICSTKLMESKEFFVGQFVAEKEGEEVGFVRLVVDGIAWVKWFKEEKRELVPISELRPHPEYRFHISDVVAKKSGSGDRGFVVGMENGNLEVEWWLNKTITVVQPEEIIKLCYFFGEDTSEEDEDDEDSSDDDTPAFLLGPVAIASLGSALLEPASSSSDEDA